MLQLMAAVTLLVLPGFCGCTKQDTADSPQTKSASADALQTELERGPVKVTIDIVPKEPRLSDEPILTLTVTAEKDVDVELPPFGQSMGEFVIRDFHEPVPQSVDGKQVLQQVYTLEPLVAGSLFVSPLVVKFTDNRGSADADAVGKEYSIETEPIKLEIATMIGADAPSLTDLRPMAEPVDLPDPRMGYFGWLGIAAGVSALVAGVYVWRRRRSRAPVGPQYTPQQLAWQEFNDLLGSKLDETDVKEFFVQLTAVVRRYIERSTGVNAPDQTTEEFLREVNQQKLFGEDENLRLGAFLESADLVKFAGFQPDPDNIKQSIHKAKQFIELRARNLDNAAAAVANPEISSPAEATS